ncbi:MAG: hypothetical protein HY563_08535 [Ignavibacteriales bacterium]|nr:hypothetical protein [Ignavibacteriales bacterium]
MAKAQRITAFSMSLQDRPGALFELMRTFKEKKVNLAGVWGYTMSPGQAEVLIVGKDAEKVRAVLKSSGASFMERAGFYAKGADKIGALLGSLEALSNAGVNLDAANAIAVGGKFGCYLWVKEEDVQRTEAALAK